SRVIGLGMLAVFVVFGFIAHLAFVALGAEHLLILAGVVFVLAWIGQFIGHAIEGQRPSFLTDLAYLLIGPAWLVSKLLKRARIAY
ncbi:MAG: Mpo1-like protein, partial [Metallibacterium sp.]